MLYIKGGLKGMFNMLIAKWNQVCRNVLNVFMDLFKNYGFLFK